MDGTCLFSSLYLTRSYFQMTMDHGSIAKTVTVGLERIHTNAPGIDEQP